MKGSPGVRRRAADKKSSSSTSKPARGHMKRSLSWWNTAKFTVIMMILAAIILYILPCPINPVVVSMPPPPKFEGPLAPNEFLKKAEKLLVGKIVGPEALELHNGVIYTGTGDGQVVKIEGDQVTTVAKFGSPPCGLQKDEHTCGRPLGLRFHTDGLLYVLDAYLGLFRVIVETGKVTKLLSGGDLVDGKPLMFLNDLDIDSDGIIYFSDSSYHWQRRENRHAIMEGTKTARVFKFNPRTGKTSVLMEGLGFANGVQLSPNQDFLLVTETIHARIHKYHLKGVKKGQVEIFADNLPGLPDNIRPRHAGGYWVGMAVIRKHPFSFYDFSAAWPWTRSLFTKLMDPDYMLKLLPKYGLVIALDQDGRIVDSLQDTSGRNIALVSSVLDTGEHLYLGSYYAKFLGRL